MNFSTLVHVQAHPNSCISLVEQNVSIIELHLGKMCTPNSSVCAAFLWTLK